MKKRKGETGPLSQGVQVGGKALRIRLVNGMDVRKKRPRRFKKEAQRVQVSPLNSLSVSPWRSSPGCSSSCRACCRGSNRGVGGPQAPCAARRAAQQVGGSAPPLPQQAAAGAAAAAAAPSPSGRCTGLPLQLGRGPSAAPGGQLDHSSCYGGRSS